MAETTWLTIDEVSSHLKVTRDTVYSYIADRGMPAHKVGRVWRFDMSEVDAWIKDGGAAKKPKPKTTTTKKKGGKKA